MDILKEIDQLIKLLEIGYKDSALVALKAIRKELTEKSSTDKDVNHGVKNSHN